MDDNDHTNDNLGSGPFWFSVVVIMFTVFLWRVVG